jgi:hypothetical protein
VRVRNLIIGMMLLLALAFAITTRAMIARAVLSPHSTRLQILTAALNPPYQMAAPHLSLRAEVHEFLSPTVAHAQSGCGGGPSPCGYLKQMSLCNPNCTSGCYCPDCLNLSGTNCTIYHCVVSTKASDTCDDSYSDCEGACQNTGPCKQ